MRRYFLAAALIMHIFPEAPAATQENGESLKQSIDRARLFAEHGRVAGDPLALIVAARLRRDMGLTQRATPRGAPSPSELARLESPETLVAEAKRLARGRRNIAALADDILAAGEKGRERGPLYDIGKLPAGGLEAYADVRFAAGKRAEVYVEGARHIALVVRDGDGKPICSDDASSPVAYCWWRPERDAGVRVEILNRASEANIYRMVTN